jgi:hypothetical protein
MNIRSLKELIRDLPDDLPVHVNDEEDGKYTDNVDAFFFKGNDEDQPALIIVIQEESE